MVASRHAYNRLSKIFCTSDELCRRRPIGSCRNVPCYSPTLLVTSVLVVQDRKSTRLNSSHVAISYAVFCLKKKKMTLRRTVRRHNAVSAVSQASGFEDS